MERDVIPSRFIRLLYKVLFRSFPRLYWQAYKEMSLNLGVDQLYLVLSFDCDTSEDILAAEYINAWMSEKNLKATYAVPGKQLLEGKETYKNISDDGGEFVNHGASPHTEWRDNRYHSITFYNQMSADEVVIDIERGHEIVKQVIGKPPLGFRAPHFGHFQKRDQLSMLYTTLKDLGYQYSSTTVPWFARKYGPAFYTNHIWEFPLSGSYHFPLQILDSWGNLENYQHAQVTEKYSEKFISSLDALIDEKIPGILNFYVDPAHVYKNEGFFNAIEYAVAQNLTMLQYADLLKILNTK